MNQGIEDIMKAWTPEHQEAARREGWDLFTATDDSPVQVQRIDAPEDLPSGTATFLLDDRVAMMMVRTGTGEHHRVARKIIYDHFPQEWALLEEAAHAATEREGDKP